MNEHDIILREFFCGCGSDQCERHIQAVLRIERGLCPRAKGELTKRRNLIRRLRDRAMRRPNEAASKRRARA